ncbi:hypothetical protein A1353_24310 [Methylomonas methanica]|uniref:Uncharacterized protein n=1 Tax=Methylomonas methanica TaxID=421 RepID=A0A177LRJ2_METMH|nr:hypothetical protein [Methylomonas methanica]OAH96127.1 hypothetical protein A1353_24310 [Methylomonas methanica]
MLNIIRDNDMYRMAWGKSILCSFLVVTILNSCTSNIYIRKDKLSANEHHYPHSVYLENTDSTYLSRLVIDSGVFSFSDDQHSEYYLKLLPDDDFYHCGGLGAAKLGSAIFFGLLPVIYDDEYKFFYEITYEGKATRFSYEVPLYSRYSIWEWLFKPFSSARDELIIENIKYLKPVLEVLKTER